MDWAIWSSNGDNECWFWLLLGLLGLGLWRYVPPRPPRPAPPPPLAVRKHSVAWSIARNHAAVVASAAEIVPFVGFLLVPVLEGGARGELDDSIVKTIFLMDLSFL